MKSKHTNLLSFLLLGGFLLFGIFSSQAQTFNMRDTTVVNICTGKLYDTGGPGSNYSNDEDSAFTITVGGTSTITLTFIDFDVRNSGDTLRVYDGANTSAPLLAGPYVGNSLPPIATSTGQSITIEFTTNGSDDDPGYEIDWNANDTLSTAITASANPYCSDSSVTFTVIDSTNGGDPDFAWEINSVLAPGSSNSFMYTATSLSDEDTVRLIMTGEVGSCYLLPTDTAEIVMDTIVEVTPLVTMVASSASICNSDSITFTVDDSTNGGADPVFQWQVNGVNVGTDFFQYTSTTLSNLDVVRVYMNSTSTNCLTRITDTSNTISVTVNDTPVVTIPMQTNLACFGVDTGSAMASATGGTVAVDYSYSWNTAPVQTTATATNLSPGSYTITVSDDNGCEDTISTVITEPTELNITSLAVTDVTSFGGANGAIDATITGGTVGVDYSYSWNTVPVQTTQDLTGLVSRTYVLTVTDDNNCEDIDSAFVDQPALLTPGTIEVSGGGATKAVCDQDSIGDLVQSTASTGGTGSNVYTWQYSDDLFTWNSIPASNSINFTYNDTLLADRFVRRRVVDASNDSAFSNALFMDYIPDLVLAITGINSSYCKNDPTDVFTGVPSGGTFGPLTYMTGNTFSPFNTPGSGPTFPVQYEYTDGNGCVSNDTVLVTVNDSDAVTFNLNPSYAPGSPVDSLNPRVTPQGGAFAGVGVYQSSPGVFVFDPNIPSPGSNVAINYSYTNGDGCVSNIDQTTTITNTNVGIDGFQTDKIYCPTDGIDTLQIAFGIDTPLIVTDSFEVFNVTRNVSYGFRQPVPGSDPAQFVFNPATYALFTPADYEIQVRYYYGVPDSVFKLISKIPLQFGWVPFIDQRVAVETINLVQTGTSGIHVNLDRILPNSNGTTGSSFQYCENLDTVPVIGRFPNFGVNRPFTHLFTTGSGNGVVPNNNSDTANMELSPLSGTTDLLTYTFIDSVSACSTEVVRNFRVDTLPEPTLILDASNDFCANDGKIFMSVAPADYDTTFSLYFSKNNTLTINQPFSQTANFDAADSTVGSHVVYYQYTLPATGCTNLDSSVFNIDTVPDLSIGLDTPNIVFNGPIATVCRSEESLLFFGEVGGTYTPNLGNFEARPGLSNLSNNSTSFDASVAGVQAFPGHDIEFKFTDGNGCRDSVTTYIVVNDLPNALFSIPMSKDSVCDIDDPIQMIANTLNFNETEQYTISNTIATAPFNGNGSIYNPGLQTSSAGQNGVDTIIRVVRDSITECVSTHKDFIFINPDPTPTISSLLPNYCLNDGTINFQFTPSFGNPVNNSPQGDYEINNYMIIDYGVSSGGLRDSLGLGTGVMTGSINTSQATGTPKQISVSYFHTVDSSGCSASVDTIINVVDLPKMALTDSISQPVDVYCYGDTTATVRGLLSTAPNSVIDSIFGFFNVVQQEISPADEYFRFFTNIPGINPDQTNGYIVRYFYTDTVTGCSNFTDTTVQIERPPTASFIFSDLGNSGNDTTVCENDNDRVVFDGLTPNPLPIGASQSFFLNGISLLTSEFRPATSTADSAGINTGRYIYRSAKGCTDTAEQVLTIEPNPIAGFIFPPLCTSDTVLFVDTSSVSSGMIDRRIWNFESVDYISFNNTIEYRFFNPGTQQIDLTVVSDENCEGTTTQILNFEEPPETSFTWTRWDECEDVRGDSVQFFQTTTSGNPGGVSTTWNFGDGNTSNDMNPNHLFAIPAQNRFVVELVNGLAGCSDTLRKEFIFRPKVVPTPAIPYFEDFESGTNGWELEYDFDRDTLPAGSWVLGNPDKDSVMVGAHSGEFAWVTGIDSSYRKGDTTYITSPCFDFSNLTEPMIRVWVNHNLDRNDGVVFEYSTDTGLVTNNNWTPLNNDLDNFNSGIHWFNQDGIASSPGKQDAFEKNVGWTEESTIIGADSNGWYEARHDLDSLAGLPNVRFRFAIGSDVGTPDGRAGFAFDDIWIGERRKNVLLETFVNSSSDNSEVVNSDVAELIENNSDVLNIQYHTNFPGSDPMNFDNQADPSARALYYSINEAPSLRMDGNQIVTISPKLEKQQVLLRALEDPGFNINMKTVKDGSNLNITAKISGNPIVLESINPNNVSLHLVVVEKEIGIAELPTNSVTNNETLFLNTMKVMAPTAAGSKFTNSWLNGEEVTVTTSASLVTFKESDDDWKVIGFVQDNITKEVYQAVYNDEGQPATGIFDREEKVEAFNFTVYPNPAQDRVFFRFDEELEGETNLVIINQLGAVIETQRIGMGALQHEVDASNYPDGMYYLVLLDAEGNKYTKKLMIIR